MLGRGVEKDLTQAVCWFRRAAEQGEPGATACLGYLYLNGKGVEKDMDQAFSLFQQAALGGSRNAQFHLGLMYRLGWATPPDEQKALYWLRAAAEQGHPLARSLLHQGQPRTAGPEGRAVPPS